jgi:hypothetical protein
MNLIAPRTLYTLSEGAVSTYVTYSALPSRFLDWTRLDYARIQSNLILSYFFVLIVSHSHSALSLSVQLCE